MQLRSDKYSPREQEMSLKIFENVPALHDALRGLGPGNLDTETNTAVSVLISSMLGPNLKEEKSLALEYEKNGLRHHDLKRCAPLRKKALAEHR